MNNLSAYYVILQMFSRTHSLPICPIYNPNILLIYKNYLHITVNIRVYVIFIVVFRVQATHYMSVICTNIKI